MVIKVLQLALVNNYVSRSSRLRVMIGTQSNFESEIENGVLSANHPAGSKNSQKHMQSEVQRSQQYKHSEVQQPGKTNSPLNLPQFWLPPSIELILLSS